MSSIRYVRPTTLTEACEILGEGDDRQLLSGGTDLAVQIRHRKVKPGVVVDTKGIPEMARRIDLRDNEIVVSANTVMTDLETTPIVQEHLPGLVEAAQVVGSVQIRNRASLAGNLCNASPAADTPPVLMSLGTVVDLFGPDGPRSVPIGQFFTGYRQTALSPAELVTGFRIPRPGPGSGNAFLKLGVRRAMEISILCVAASITLDADRNITSAGIALGSVAPHTTRATTAESALIGRPISDRVCAEVGEAAAADCSPIDDVRASAEYRAAMVPVLVRRALRRALERAGIPL